MRKIYSTVCRIMGQFLAQHPEEITPDTAAPVKYQDKAAAAIACEKTFHIEMEDERVGALKTVAEARTARTPAAIMVLRRPKRSKAAPVRMRPKPLQTERIPTSTVAAAEARPTETARSLAMEITAFPPAARKTIIKSAFQKAAVFSISAVV